MSSQNNRKKMTNIVNTFMKNPTSIYDLYKAINSKIFMNKHIDNYLDQNKPLFHNKFIKLIQEIDPSIINTDKVKESIQLLEQTIKRIISNIQKKRSVDIIHFNILFDLTDLIYKQLFNKTSSSNRLSEDNSNVIQIGSGKLTRRDKPDCLNAYDNDDDCWTDPITMGCVDDNYLVIANNNMCYDARGLSRWFQQRERLNGDLPRWPDTMLYLTYNEIENVYRVSSHGLNRRNNIIPINRINENNVVRINSPNRISNAIIILGIIALLGYLAMHNPTICYLLVGLFIIILTIFEALDDSLIFQDYTEMIDLCNFQS